MSWKYVIPVVRFTEDPDGMVYIEGEASGPERDQHGTEMDTTAIEDFARQIADRYENGDPLPFIDQHQKVGVLRELGHVVSGSLSPDFHLKVRVALDTANPAAAFVHNNLQRGKQYGMSIAGDGVDFKMVRDGEKRVVRFLRVVLREISLTPRPSWTHSLGTVLARSIESNEENMSEELITGAPDGDTARESEQVAPEEPVAEQPQAVEENVNQENPEREVHSEEETDVERARVAKADRDAIVAAFAALSEQLKNIGITSDENSTPEPQPVENSETGGAEMVDLNGYAVERNLANALQTLVSSEIERVAAPLREIVEKQSEYIKQLEEMPAGKLPAPIVREKFTTSLNDIASLSPEERLRIGLSGVYGR